MTFPQDPFILLSTVNTLLRDKYPTLAELCKSESIDIDELTNKLASAGFEYSTQNNKFW